MGIAWRYLFSLSFMAVYLLVFMAWLFDVTKPSFMDSMGFGEKLGILALSGLLTAAPVLLAQAALFGISRLPGIRRAEKAFLILGSLLPAATIALIVLTLADNFTYTVLKFGILTSKGGQRGIYAATFSLLCLASVIWVNRRLLRQARRKRLSPGLKAQQLLGAATLVPSLVVGAVFYKSAGPASAALDVNSATKHPNILLIGSDGLDVDRMSVYGYSTDTTPFLKTFAPGTLFAENNFPNANITAGSLVSLFTGKLPTVTRTLYPPDILQGQDAFQHLPDILKNEGYYNAELSVDYYADMNNLNMQDSFVMVNGRSTALGSLYTTSREIIPEDAAYFLSSTAKGFSDRLMQIFYIKTISNPYSEVTLPLETTTDQERVDQAMTLFETIQQPLFVHVHMMGTHSGSWTNYDQEIKDFDGYMQQVIERLTKMGKLDQTVIIVYTDHGFQNVTNVRIPLMIRFPNGEHAGVITHNTQNLDIAPTVLDYLGILPPAWMGGQSLLEGEPPAARPIFSAAPNYRSGNSKNELQLDLSKIKPPFYQFGTISMVVCQKWYALDTSKLSWQEGEIQDYPTPCAASSLPTDAQARLAILDEMRADGFDISSFTSLTRIGGQGN